MAQRSFKAETQQLLDLVINSIYTHREIFLREIISNASDALDKLKFKALTEPNLLKENEELEIKLEIDKDAKTLTISDNGIGMTYDEVIENIGTIAKSGSKEFLKKLESSKESDKINELIGQFGVGFYSVFMVAKKVSIKTKSPYSEEGVLWKSTGDGKYSIEKIEKENRGTEITLYFKDEVLKEENYLDQYKISELVKKYSDFISYPVKMDFYTEKPEEKDKDGKITKEKEIEVEEKILNSMKPLWLRKKSEIKEEEYEEFYKQAFHAWDKPLDIIHSKAEGKIEYTMLLFIPEKAPYDFYSVNYERGLKLYSKQIFIMDKNKDLLPEYLGFVKGLVDSPDFSLNISREILQHSSQLKLVAKNIEKKILQSLKYMLENNREKYEKFWAEFGRAIKAGINMDFGANSDKIKDLLLYPSSNSEKLTSLKEYVSRMPEEQKEIYYAAGKDRNTVEHLPQLESFKEKGYEVLYFIDKVDEFSAITLREYDGKPIKSIADSSISVEENKEEIKKIEEENKTLLETIKDVLKDKVSEVKISSRLKKSPVCITSGKDGLSLNIEHVLKEAGQDNFGGIKSDKILELNPNHNIFKSLKTIYEKDAKSDKIKTYAGILYNQALLLEGIPVENPSEFAQQIATLMEEI